MSIHFGEGKTKSILFASKHRAKNIRQLNIKYRHIKIKRQIEVTYIWCMPGKTMSGEPVVLKVINKINGKLKIRLLIPELWRMLCNALI